MNLSLMAMLPGGQTDKIGNRYEHWWTVHQLVRLITGDALSIRIEQPGVEKSEFVIITSRGQEYHQTKRSHTDGKWSLAQLGNAQNELLQAIYPLLHGNGNEFHFISGCDAPELRELSDRARGMESWEEFSAQALAAQEHQQNFSQRLLPKWGNPAGADAYRTLRRIFVHTGDEQLLIELVKSQIRSLYLASPSDVIAELRGIVQDKVGVTLRREELLDTLKNRGFQLRKLPHADMALPVVASITAKFVEGLSARLIGNAMIPRKAADDIVARITAGTGIVTALTGKPGGGKSACTLQLVNQLSAAGYPVLALRLDRIAPVSTAAELGAKLGLEESPALVVAAAAQGRPAVLVLDQLDAVSSVSGRNAGFLEAVEDVVREARGLSIRSPLHVVVVCRKFDWENDHRLRGLVQKEEPIIELTDFTDSEVAGALSTIGFDFTKLAQHQKELLRHPQSLSLFMAAAAAQQKLPAFGSTKDLFDAYWGVKREAVRLRAAPEMDRWGEVIDHLAAHMTETQRLSVEREQLDAFPQAYVEQMISEGVLSAGDGQIGFGHESFFDYCYARWFLRTGQTLLHLLQSGEQHLFRRAQVRQVLAYLRDSNVARYCAEVQSLLTSPDVRTHIKDLTLSILANVPEVKEEEWALLYPRLKAYVAVIAEHGEHRDKEEVHFWRHIFGSDSWFRAANERGVVASWLASDGDYVANLITHYVRFHQRKNGDAVAALLEPYADACGQWPLRLRSCMEWADLESSRRYFDLLLRLIDNGVLDEARCRFAQNGTFWSMLYGLTQSKPEWLPEVFARWLRRRYALLLTRRSAGETVRWSELFRHDRSGSVGLRRAAEQYPGVFVDYLLPLFLEISAAAASSAESLPRLDAIWQNLFPGEHPSMEQSYQSALSKALVKLVQSNAPEMAQVIQTLRSHDTYAANTLLLSIYTAGSSRYADEAVDLLLAQPWRLQCGYSDSSYWHSRELINAIAPCCSAGRLAALETMVLDYTPEWERTARARRRRGRASFELLSAIPEPLRSDTARRRLQEFERKLGSPSGPPKGFRSGFIGSPIEKDKAALMSDRQWLRAISRFDSEDRSHRYEDFLKGGALELARLLEEFTKNEPERFGSLALQFPPGTNASYIDHVLCGLGGASVALSLKLDVCRKAYSESRELCAKTIARFLGGVEEPLPADCLAMIQWIATEHPDPDEELWRVTQERSTPYYGGDIYTAGINSARGCAAEALANLIDQDPAYIERLMPVLESLVQDSSTAVRACAARALLALAVHDAPQAIALFGVLAENGPALLATPFGERFIYHGLRDHFSAMRPYIEILLRSGLEAPAQLGAQFASLAVLHGHDAQGLVNEALSGTSDQRMGVAKIAASNIAQAECRVWCEPLLRRFFEDEASDVRREAGHCFSRLEDAPLGEFEGLIAAYCDSPAYEEDSFWILQILEKTRYRLPGIVWTVCDRFLARFSREGADISTGRAGDARTVATLVYRTYQQHLDDEWAPKCLNLIDTMLLEGIYDAGSRLAAFER